jgi:hypothetical protein
MFDAQSDKLEAAPDEVHREMERLDALILEGAIERGGREHR